MRGCMVLFAASRSVFMRSHRQAFVGTAVSSWRCHAATAELLLLLRLWVWLGRRVSPSKG